MTQQVCKFNGPPCSSFFVCCRYCQSTRRLPLGYLGSQVRCSSCSKVYTAIDSEIESAAMEEDVSKLAKVLEWSGDDLKFATRPR